MPLSLISYTANLLPGGKVKLSWETAVENNVSRFIISKSKDGGNFLESNTLPAAGNSSLAKSYEVVDKTPFEGVNYYRLEQVDLTGKIISLGIKTIMVTNKFSKSTIFPNPSKGGAITLRSEISANTPNIYLISDASGRIVKKGSVTSTEQPLNVSGLSTGNYTIILSNGEAVKWIKN